MVEAFYNLINLIGNAISETIKFLLDLKVCMVETFYNLSNLIDNIISKNISFLLSFDIKDYFKTAIIDEVAIATAIGSLSFSIVIIIFLVQNISKNEEYRYNNQSVAIYDFCNLKFIIVVDSLIIIDIVLIDLQLNFISNIAYLIFLLSMYLLLFINICYYLYIFSQSKKIIIGDSSWLDFYQKYNWEIINNLFEYHNKIVKKTSHTKKNILKQIDKLNKHNNKRMKYCIYKLDHKQNSIFTLYSAKDGILKNVNVKRIKNIINEVIPEDSIYVDICINFDDELKYDSILIEFYEIVQLEDDEKNRLKQAIISKRTELNKCFDIYNIQTQNAINSFKYLYGNKLIVNYDKDEYIFNFLLYNAISETYEQVGGINSKEFLDIFFYNLKLISNSNSMYSFHRNCEFLINIFYDTDKDLQWWDNDKIIRAFADIFNIVKNKYDFVEGFVLVLLYLIANKNLSDASREMLFRCWFQYEDYTIEDKGKENELQEYNVLKFHFNAIVLYYIDNKMLKNAGCLNDSENSTSELRVDIDYLLSKMKDEYFKNYSIFDYLIMLNTDSDLFRNFVHLNYGLDNSKARYDLFILLVKFYKPDVNFSEKDFEIHFNDIKSYRFQYIYRELMRNDYKDDEYKNELREFIGQLIKKQVDADYNQKYLDNFNNNFADNLVDKSNITLMHIYLRILQENKLIIKSNEIDNCIAVPYNKLIFKDLYSDDIWSASECSSISYSICYDLDKELLKYFCDNAVELDKKINYDEFICVSIFNADIKFEYRVKFDDLKIGNEYYKYLFIKKDSLPELIWPNNPKFDLNIDGKLNNIKVNKNIERTINKNIKEDNIGKLIIYNAPMLKYKDNVVIYKSKFLSKN